MDDGACSGEAAKPDFTALDKTFAKGLRLIEHLSARPTPVGVSEAGRTCGFARTARFSSKHLVEAARLMPLDLGCR